MVKPLDISTVELASTIIGSLMYGVFLTLFPSTLYVIFWDTHRSPFGSLSRFRKTVIVICVSLFCTISANWILSILWAFDAFVKFRDLPGGPSAYYAVNPKFLLRGSLLIYQVIAGDIVIIYRLYLVWSRNVWIVVLPCLAALGLTVFGFITMIELGMLNKSLLELDRSAVFTTIISFIGLLSCTMAIKLYSCFMIGFRAWRSNRTMRKTGGSAPLPYIQIAMESAGLYSFATFFAFASFVSGSLVGLPALDISGSFLGTTLCLLVLRVRIFGSRRLPRLSGGVVDPAPIFALGPIDTDDTVQLTEVYLNSQNSERGISPFLERGFDLPLDSAARSVDDTPSTPQLVRSSNENK